VSAERKPRRRERTDTPRLLHHLAALLSLGERSGAGLPGGVADRRHRQHLALTRRLLDPLPPALRTPDRGAGRFWRALRWGGPGLLIGWWLGR
jgi:hypothetical protein